MTKISAFATHGPTERLGPFTFDARPVGPRDVRIAIRYCGVCHSDLHQAKNEWGGSIYPMVPGHEIVGHVAEVGAEVTRFAVGDPVGVGCMVESCRTCGSCSHGEEQYCENGGTFTYNSRYADGSPAYGGYAKAITVNQDFVLKIPKNLPLDAAAPLLCAGVTMWSPISHWKIGAGHEVGVVGLGGLGHMAVKLAKARGARVTQFTTSPNKVEDARRLGADDVVVTRDPSAIAALGRRFDFILDTVSAPHDLNALLGSLKTGGSLILVGLPDQPPTIYPGLLVTRRRSLSGSMIGGIRETQEMLDFCGEHGITSDIEVIPMQAINEAYERMLKNDVKYRFVIDLASLAPADG
ncbi:MAG TPA: NAD(P)-dependent alcohol dehydrogenase [Myxococcota bacterium]|nr:NAD(P)-dependent alcohol dehydrogenase [Myxococcota bacterium]